MKRVVCRTLMARESGQLVNELGDYFKSKTDGAFKLKRSGNMVDIWMRVYYQIPAIQIPGEGKQSFPIQEMVININLTSYANKLRVNLIQVHPTERTLGHFVIPTEKLTDIENARKELLSRIYKRLHKLFEGYEFIY